MNSRGFTLLEVMIALGVLSGSIYVLTDLNIKSLWRVYKDRDELEKMFLVKKQLAEQVFVPIKSIKPRKEPVEKPVMIIETTLPELSQKSALQTAVGDCCKIVRVEGTWKYAGMNRSFVLGALYFDPAVLDEKKKDKK